LITITTRREHKHTVTANPYNPVNKDEQGLTKCIIIKRITEEKEENQNRGVEGREGFNLVFKFLKAPLLRPSSN